MSQGSGSEYYRGKTVLVTGATGFLGKALIEALFDRLPQIRRIYVLMRPRSDGNGRLQSLDKTIRTEILASPIFAELRERHAHRFTTEVGARITPVPGDLGLKGLGLTPEWHERLVEEVDIIINSAALAQFDAPLDQALTINARSPMEVLELARAGRRRPFLAHVSTCYVGNVPGPVFESPPQAPNGQELDPDAFIALLGAEVERIMVETEGQPQQRQQRLEQAGLDRAREMGWNDVYTLTKALGELALQRHRGDVSMLTLRPSIIESALDRPLPGWIEGLRMMDPLVVGYAMGRVFEFPGHPETVLDVIPLDRVVNALLMAIPYCHQRDAPDLYQVCSGTQRPLLIKQLVADLEAYYRDHPLNESVRLPKLTLPECERFLRRLNWRYLGPLMVAESALRALAWLPGLGGWHQRLQRNLRNVHRLKRYAAIYGPYASARMRFVNFNTRALWRQMDPADQRRFPFTIDQLDWQDYLHRVHLPGLERYVLDHPNACPEPLHLDSALAAESKPAGLDSGRTVHWRRAHGMLDQTRLQPPEAVKQWATPVHKRAVHRTNLALMQLITRGYLRLRTRNTEHLPQRGPFVVVSNHTSHIDTGALLSALGRESVRVHPIAASDYWFSSRWFGIMLHATLSAIPFDRSAGQILPALALPAEILRLGHSLIFFPEGTRSTDGKLKPFKSSVGLLALAAAAPLVPAYISGAHEALPKGRTLMKPGSVRVCFGQPLRIEPYLDRLGSQAIARVASDIASDAHRAVARLRSASDGQVPLTGGDHD
jgi:1-acyl-sn-glycerol-3-phosphate acyltransferase